MTELPIEVTLSKRTSFRNRVTFTNSRWLDGDKSELFTLNLRLNQKTKKSKKLKEKLRKQHGKLKVTIEDKP